jgi:hypothetical protein
MEGEMLQVSFSNPNPNCNHIHNISIAISDIAGHKERSTNDNAGSTQIPPLEEVEVHIQYKPYIRKIKINTDIEFLSDITIRMVVSHP